MMMQKFCEGATEKNKTSERHRCTMNSKLKKKNREKRIEQKNKTEKQMFFRYSEVRQKLRSVIPCTYLMYSHVRYKILHLTTTTYAFAESQRKNILHQQHTKKTPNAVPPTETLPAQTPPPLPLRPSLAVDNPVANAAAAINVPTPSQPTRTLYSRCCQTQLMTVLPLTPPRQLSCVSRQTPLKP